MKIKNILAATIAVFALASCSNDEITQEATVNPGLISFDVVTDNISRSNTLWTSQTNLKQDFKVYATQEVDNYDPEATDDSGAMPDQYIFYIKGETAYYNNGDWSFSTHYWPKDKADGTERSLNFYAFSGFDKSTFTKVETHVDEEGGGMYADAVNSVILPSASDKQEDMVYAVTSQQTKSTNGGKVVLNFRHALAQLQFKAQNKSKGIFVKVGGVELVNIRKISDGFSVLSKDQSTLAVQSTSTQYIDDQNHTYQTPLLEWNYASRVSKDNLGTEYIGANYETDNYDADKNEIDSQYLLAKAIDLKGGDAAQDIVSAATNDGIMFVYPQKIRKLSEANMENIREGNDLDINSDNAGYMYFLVTCAIQNVSSGNGTLSDDDIWLYGGPGATVSVDSEDGGTTNYTPFYYKKILIPVKTLCHTGSSDETIDLTSWEAGKKYVYTFIFGQDADGNPGNGGLDPQDPDPDNPILKDIEIDTNATTVDDYFIEGTVNQHMTYPDTEGQDD